VWGDVAEADLDVGVFFERSFERGDEVVREGDGRCVGQVFSQGLSGDRDA
jgi:hypothetical protein